MSKFQNPHKRHKVGSSSVAKRSFCDRASRANESSPSPRHRVKTPPKERSIGFPCFHLTRKKARTGSYSGPLYFLTTQHDRTGEDGCLITMDHFGAHLMRRALQDDDRNRAVIRRRFTLRLVRADIFPNSMDAVAVEVAWPRRYHRGCRR
jgi:hypothetical protein